MRALTRPALLLLSVSLGSALVTTTATGLQTAEDKTIFVGVVDQSGKPVKDVRMGEILIREDGQDREVVSVKPSSETLAVALLVDTTPGAEPYIRDIRNGFAGFVKQASTAAPGARLMLMEFGQAAIAIEPFTDDYEKLTHSINRVFPKQRAASVLLEAIIASAAEFPRQPSRRRAIVAFNMEPSDEQSREDPRRVTDALRRSGAQVWSLSLQKGTARNAKRDVVLGQIAKNTGGHREFIVAESAIETYLRQYADALAGQYEVTYKRPAGARANVVQTGTTRQGARLHASLFAPE
jgi:VWFA-related protein